MGGGDLNLKKSWHPSTLRNIERVWKAEQKHEAEKQKIEQLQKELAEERAREEIQAFAEDQGVVKKKGERLDWMYQGPAALVNREEYLLGRKVDKTFEILEQQESGKDAPKDNEQPGAIFSQSSVSTTVDLANKIREDPLFSIMKKEKEERKTLLNNPVKMKQLQQLLKQSLSGEKKKKKKKKSKKKHKRSRHESDSADSSDSDSEVSSVNVKRQKKEHLLQENSQANGEKKYRHSIQKERDFSEIDAKYSHESYRDYKRSSDNSRITVDHHERKESRSSGHSYKSRESSDHKNRDYSSRELSNGRNHDGYRNGERKEEKKKLSSEDKERLRQEMMDNAKWREEQRQRNVQRYETENEKESKERKGSSSDFIRPMLSKAAASGSVESRVRQKIFTIQRSRGDMDRNFARR